MARIRVTVAYSYRQDDEDTVTVSADSFAELTEGDIREALEAKWSGGFEDLQIDSWTEDD